MTVTYRGLLPLFRIAVVALAPAIAALAAPTVAHAQPADTSAAAPRESKKPLFTKRDAWMGVGFVALTLAATAVDEPIARNLQDPDTQANDVFEWAANSTQSVTESSFIIGGTLWAVGRVTGNAKMADLGWHGTEAILVGTGAYILGKGIFGRARPETVNARDPRNYKFGRGFKGGPYASFPSGHTTTAFAAAAAVTAEIHSWAPKYTWVVAPAMYGGATMMGLSRMYENKHWASDVAMGALLGTISGLKVVHYHHTHPGNKLDKLILGARVMPMNDGTAAVALSLSPRLLEFPRRPAAAAAPSTPAESATARGEATRH